MASCRVSPHRSLVFLALTSSARLGHPRLPVRSLATSSSTWLTSACSLQKKKNFHSSARRLAVPRNPYEVLKVPTDASARDIKKAYFELARKYHPDSSKEPGAKDKFIEIQQAYDTLGDEKKRAAYDRYGAASQQQGFDPDAFSDGRGPFGAGGFGGFQDFATAFGAGGSGGPQSELFEQLFGAFTGRPRGQHIRGDDIQVSVNLSFIDACKGTTRTIKTTPIVDCQTCTGSGLRPGKKRSKCSSCGGTGTRTFVVDSGFQMASTCTTCRGTGSFVARDAQCVDCSGMGRVKVPGSVNVNIPAGVEDGMTIRVSGGGDRPIHGNGSPGDLLVRVNVSPSRVFQRQGSHLMQQVRIPLQTALLGGRIRVPTLDGEVEIKVSSGTQPGEECILRGRGVPSVKGGSKGDMFVTFQVQIPRSLTARQRELIERFADDDGREGTDLEDRAESGTNKAAGVEGSEGSNTRENGDERGADGEQLDRKGRRQSAAG